jgi:hypothetical protein
MFLTVSFLIPLGEVLILGKTEPFGKAGIVHAVLGAFAIYWWYYLDKIERGFRTGTFQNIGVAVFSLVGLPVYFVRSRGWLKGAGATFIALIIFVVAGALGYVGELAGAALRSNKALQRTGRFLRFSRHPELTVQEGSHAQTRSEDNTSL